MGMIILDDRDKGSTVSNTVNEGSTITNTRESTIVDSQGNVIIVEQPVNTEVVSLGDGQYLRGEKGDEGKAPAHRWVGTAVQFKQPSGLWGPLIDLQGIKGDEGDQGSIGPKGDGIVGNPGITRFTWIKYSTVSNPTSAQMFNELAEPVFIGLAYNKTVDQGEGDPTEGDPNTYTWKRIKGADGPQGAAGSAGSPGAAGDSFNWIGSYSSFPLTGPQDRALKKGDTLLLTTNNKVYTYDGGWFLMIESGGEGPIGPQGAPGGSFQYKGEFSTPPSSAQVNWLFKKTPENIYYMYDGIAWVIATSDGKQTIDGADVGDGLRFFVTYSSYTGLPQRPLGNGIGSGANNFQWNVNANSFEPGTIKWFSQKLSTNPELGIWSDPIDISTHDFRAPQGFRGSQSILVAIENWNGNWDDKIAASSCTGGAPTEWDIVTLYKSNDPEVQETRRWGFNSQTNSWEWLAYNYQFLGDVLVDGTLDAGAVNANTKLTVGTGDNVAVMTGEPGLPEQETYRIWAGNALGEAAPFSVTQEGKLVATGAEINGDIRATSLEFPDALGPIGELSLNQLSGGGHESNNNVGWGIYNDGRAIFNGGLETRDAVISGATIIGSEIYGGDLLNLVDPDTDGDPNDPTLYYDNYPDVPVGSSSSFSSTVTSSYSRSYIQANQPTADYYVFPAARSQDPISSKRCRWGIINANTFKLTWNTLAGGRTDNVLHYRIHIHFDIQVQLIDPITQQILATSPVFSTYNVGSSSSATSRSITHSCAGVSFTANYNLVKTGTIYVGGTKYYTTYNNLVFGNNKSLFGSTSNSSLNGHFRLKFSQPFSSSLNGSNEQINQIITVDNNSIPSPL